MLTPEHRWPVCPGGATGRPGLLSLMAPCERLSAWVAATSPDMTIALDPGSPAAKPSCLSTLRRSEVQHDQLRAAVGPNSCGRGCGSRPFGRRLRRGQQPHVVQPGRRSVRCRGRPGAALVIANAEPTPLRRYCRHDCQVGSVPLATPCSEWRLRPVKPSLGAAEHG